MASPRISTRIRIHAPLAALAGALLGGAARTARADDYPARPVKIVVPSAPGGTTDLLGRAIANRLQALWKQPVVVDNRPGAGLRLGAEMVARSPSDGYTLLVAAVHHAIAQAVYKKRSYDLETDLAPVTIAAVVPNVLIVPAKLPVRNVAEFIALARAEPGKVAYGSTGHGTAHQIIAEQFADRAQVRLLHVPYKGSAPALTDLMGGQIQAMFDTIPSCLPHIESGSVRPLAVTSAKRSPALPAVPTLDESGMAGFDISTWFGLMAPAGTPAAVIDKIQREVVRMLATADMKKQLTAAGIEPLGTTPQEMGQRIHREIASFEALARKLNLELD